jgi:branched-chain amino acid aminotransferase
MIGTFYINGEPIDGKIPVTDSSVLRGDACFEVLKAYGGKVFGLEEHLDRLEFSARALGIPLPDREEISSWVSRSAAEVGDCAVRVVVTRGGSVPGVDDPPRVIVFSHTWPRPGNTTTLLPVTAPWHAVGAPWDLAGAKVTSYAPNVSATRRAQSGGFGDALLIGTGGQMLEGPTFAVAWVVDGRLETATLELGILDSITRRVVLDSARDMGVEVVEGIWKLERLDEASEALAMSTIREVQGVTAIGDRSFEPGPVTSRLADAYEELTRSL